MPKSKSKRVTRQPPPKTKPKESPLWVGALFFTLLLTGVTIIIVNYIGLLPDQNAAWALWYGLGLISGAFVVATQWH
ncbi:MAG TPA: cell division protein CrgA [Actinomycetota bacterium]|nr:cell division protein CrgA [Actinomycetota bacterium]